MIPHCAEYYGEHKDEKCNRSNRSYDMPADIGGNSVQKVALALALAMKDEY